MVRIKRSYRIQVCGHEDVATGELPSDPQQTDSSPSRRRAMQKAPVAVHLPSACSGVKALRNTSDAKAASRQALLAFRSLDPFRALREPDRRRRDEERPFPLRTKNRQTTISDQMPAAGKSPLTWESPIQVRIRFPPAASLQTVGPSRGALNSGQRSSVPCSAGCAPCERGRADARARQAFFDRANHARRREEDRANPHGSFRRPAPWSSST